MLLVALFCFKRGWIVPLEVSCNRHLMFWCDHHRYSLVHCPHMASVYVDMIVKREHSLVVRLYSSTISILMDARTIVLPAWSPVCVNGIECSTPHEVINFQSDLAALSTRLLTSLWLKSCSGFGVIRRHKSSRLWVVARTTRKEDGSAPCVRKPTGTLSVLVMRRAIRCIFIRVCWLRILPYHAKALLPRTRP